MPAIRIVENHKIICVWETSLQLQQQRTYSGPSWHKETTEKLKKKQKMQTFDDW